jgi:redox-sensitive bicupin YhaK (pirin superfamily)
MHPTNPPGTTARKVQHRTRGFAHGMITRLMSPSDLGERLKPFVFLDIFRVDKSSAAAMADMPVHPHSGIATVTVITQGHLVYQYPSGRSGEIGYGGTEWMLAGNGIWHGKEMGPGPVDLIQGFQLWLALPPELENSAPNGHFFEATDMHRVGPAHLILGQYQGTQSPVPAPEGINYLLVTLAPGETWTYAPPSGHSVTWLALAQGELLADQVIEAGDMVVFEAADSSVALTASGTEGAVFVLGSAVPHPYSLHLGNYSVHTSQQSLAQGEHQIVELGKKMRTSGNPLTSAGTTPIYL